MSSHRLTLLLIGAALLAATGCPDSDSNSGNPIPMPVTRDMTPGPTPDMSGVDMSGVLTDMSGADMASDMSAAVDMRMEDMRMEDMRMEDMTPVCVPRTEVELCEAYSFECGRLEVEECGEMVVVQDCGGGCPTPALCEETLDASGAITATQCECSPNNVEQICSNVGKLCGQIDNLPPGVCDTLPACDEFCVDSLSAGNDFNCAIGSGKLRCWGNNKFGQLGLGDKTLRKNPDEQIQLSLPVEQISAGGSHTCAILQDNSLICWGKNSSGQLGVGTSVDAQSPDLSNANSRAFAKDSGIAKVVTGEEHTCALIDTDYNPASGQPPSAPYTAYCWGSNEFGIVGNSNFLINTTIAVPKTVDGLTDNVYDIAAGSHHTCAIVKSADPSAPATERNIKCWGRDRAGQFGVQVPIQIDSSAPEDGEIPFKPFPFLDSYRIERDNIYSATPLTTQSPDFQNIITISGANNNKGRIYTHQTGHPFKGELLEISAGRTFTCARDASDQVWCWGLLPFKSAANVCKQTQQNQEPKFLCSIWPPNLSQWVAGSTANNWPVFPMLENVRNVMIDTRQINTTFLPKIGLPIGLLDYVAVAARPLRMTYSSDMTLLPTGEPPSAFVKAKQISAHHEHLCVLVEESNPTKSNVYCLGRNQNGEIGDGTNSPTGYMVPIRGDVNGNIVSANRVEIGDEHSCAIVNDSNIKCWGSNEFSQIGNENLMKLESFIPFDVLLR